MRRRAFALGLTVTLGVGATRAARAGEMEPTPERLVLQPANLPAGRSCQSVAADPAAIVGAGLRPQDFPCRPNNPAFRNMIAELGFAMAPTAFYPARSTGLAGIQVTLEASYTRISPDRAVDNPDGSRTPYWHLGTRGPTDPNTSRTSIVNNAPDSLISVYALKVRKGLGLGFEIAGSFGVVANTGLWVGGGDVRWSILEGFRKGPLGYVPDVSVGGGVRTVTGSSKLYLTTVGIDARVSKPITTLGAGQIVPQLGYQRLIVFGDSAVVDATPNVDALRECGYAGSNAQTGAPICNNKLPNGADANTDFANNFTFNAVRIHRHRGLVGVNYRYEVLWIGTQFAFDLTDPGDENPGLVGSKQWTLSFEGGVFF